MDKLDSFLYIVIYINVHLYDLDTKRCLNDYTIKAEDHDSRALHARSGLLQESGTCQEYGAGGKYSHKSEWHGRAS